MKGTKLAALVLGCALMTGISASPAFDSDESGITVTREESSEDTPEETVIPASRISDDINADAEPEDQIVTADGATKDAALTPDGNMRLVDDIVTDGGKQFITLATRDGHIYYLIIDRSSSREENVYFLNQVDERDLLSVMNDEDKAQLEKEEAESAEQAAAEEARKKAEEEAAKKAAEAVLTKENDISESASDPAKESGSGQVIRIGNTEIPVTAVLIGFAVFAVLVAAVVISALKRKKGCPARMADPDAGYEDDYDDEYVLEEEDEEDRYGRKSNYDDD